MISIDALKKREAQIAELEKMNSKLEGELSAAMARLDKEYNLHSIEEAEQYVSNMQKEIQENKEEYTRLEKEYNEDYR